MNALKALIQNRKMANATSILHLLFSLKMTSQELLRKTQTCKTKKPVQPRLGGFGRHCEYGVLSFCKLALQNASVHELTATGQYSPMSAEQYKVTEMNNDFTLTLL